jgi:hypothetical protein
MRFDQNVTIGFSKYGSSTPEELAFGSSLEVRSEVRFCYHLTVRLLVFNGFSRVYYQGNVVVWNCGSMVVVRWEAQSNKISF